MGALSRPSGDRQRPGAGRDEAVADAIALSHLGTLPGSTIARLLEDAADVLVPGGGLIHPEGGEPFIHLVVHGLVRVVASSPDSRQATIRYARHGDMLGTGSLFSTHPDVVACVALRETRVLMLRPGIVRDLARSDTGVAGALIAELSDRVIGYHGELIGSSFAGLRQKVARHLLDIATADPVGHPLVARISQAALADAVGSSREVIVRVLHDLRAAGLVETGRGGITIIAPERLHEESWPATP